MAAMWHDHQDSTISPLQMHSDYYAEQKGRTESPSPSVADSAPSSENGSGNKRKRKSWGQPIPDFPKNLPPGKRAKTVDEKEQRRCERIMRNRKAAATSRDRKKQEFDRIEQENKRLKEELAQLKAWVDAHQAGQPLPTLAKFEAVAPLTPAFSPVDSGSDCSINRPASPAISVFSLSNHKKESPTLAPPLFPDDDPRNFQRSSQTIPDFDDMRRLSPEDLQPYINDNINNPEQVLHTLKTGNDNPSLTQYPAEVLCDQQCQLGLAVPESKVNHSWMNSVLITQLMVLTAMSNIWQGQMISVMSRIMATLEQLLPSLLTASTSTLEVIFPLIYSLIISTSMEKEQPRRSFRMAFLRKLLSMNPAWARLIDAATSRALRKLSSAKAIVESKRDAPSWSSLMAMRWAIRCVEQEQELHHSRLKVSSSTLSTVRADRGSGKVAFQGVSTGSLHSKERVMNRQSPGIY